MGVTHAPEQIKLEGSTGSFGRHRLWYTLHSDVANRAGSRWKVVDIPGGGACVLGR